MTYEIFAEEVCNGVKEALNETYTVQLVDTMKVNDTRKVQLLCSDYLEEISAGRNFYIIPSSVHELILLSEMPGQEQCIEELNQMVQEVNRDMVAEEEVLADHMYFYDAESKEIQIC